MIQGVDIPILSRNWTRTGRKKHFGAIWLLFREKPSQTSDLCFFVVVFKNHKFWFGNAFSKRIKALDEGRCEFSIGKNHIEKYHWILFLGLVENQSVSARLFARFEPTPYQSIESWVHSDGPSGLDYPDSVHIPMGSVQAALIHLGDGFKGAYSKRLDSIYMLLEW